MNRRLAGSVHGETFAAPAETFVTGESPRPGDVQERAEPSRFDRVWLALRMALGIAAVVGTSLLVATSAHRYAVTSPRFALREITLSGQSRMSPDAIREQGGIKLGTNIFAVDPRAVEARLLQDPWIASARVARRLPTTLEIEIKERNARALAAVGESLYLVSREGEPFKQVEAKDPSDLPLVTGLHAENLQHDRARELERLGVALEVLAQYERLAMSRVYAAEEVHISDGGAITLTVGREGVTLALGASSFRQRLLMAERVVEEARQSGHLPGIVFADNTAHPERVVVRMR